MVAAILLPVTGWWMLRYVADGSSQSSSRGGENSSAPDQAVVVSTAVGDDDSWHSAVRVARSFDAEPGGGSDQNWDHLTSIERVRTLEARFDEALELLDAGDPRAATRAADSLTALRSELYENPEGRARHAALERRLDEASAGGRK